MSTRLASGLLGSLRARVLLPTVVLSALTIAGMVLLAVELYAADMARGQDERLQLFSGVIAGALTTAMLQQGPRDLPEILRVGAGHMSDVISINVLRPSGEVAFSSDPTLLGTRPWEAPSVSEDVRRETRTLEVDGTTAAVLRPVRNLEGCVRCHGEGSKVNGWIDVRYSRQNVVQARARLMQVLTLAALPAVALLLAIAWVVLARQVVHPLRRITEAMSRAEGGDLTVELEETRGDELGRTASGFDAMIAALRRSRAELEAFYRERLALADRFASVGELASGLAHEVRNPLAGLSGALEVLEEDLAGEERYRVLAGKMRHQIDRVANAMTQFLDFARPPKARLEPTDLNATLKDVLFLVEKQKHAVPVKVEALLAEGLPGVLADPSQMTQVFLNLCLNAVQAMEAGGTLAVRTWVEDGRVGVEVSDTGPGIPLDVRPNIFKPFYTTKRGGTGLGLPVSARIVAEHGGQIEYRCPDGGGTIFTVRLRQADQPMRRAS